jgi:hypothetical protein
VKRILLPLVALAVASPIPTQAQGGEQAYCTELSALYRKYVQNARGRGFDADGAWALEACSKGNTEAAIPVLEKKLRDSGFSLPKEFKP